ncbi:uncharacterized protein LOC120924742 isoform X1 [Rana temporaria]|uniref:uncharacterized protein LOC120924742 isoform X1 n=1 Tax=Rana temporaria TaxID=8407 RepID=UPI001AAD486F|nr:uncharacterized protein LOC120924742 isoform X1 [Rana temporaria]
MGWMERIPVLGEKVLVLSPQTELYNEALCPRSSPSAGSGQCPGQNLQPGQGRQKFNKPVLPEYTSGLHLRAFPGQRIHLSFRLCTYRLFLWDGLWIVGHQGKISVSLPVRQNGLDSGGLLQE